jgi:hypothetical protein
VKFFTPDLLERFGSQDAEVARAAQEELELRTEEYLRSLEEIGPILPPRFRELLDRFYLHDALVLIQSDFVMNDTEWLEHSVRAGVSPFAERDRHAPWFWIPLRLDAPPKEILVLQYRDVEFEDAELHRWGFEECPYLEWQHDEVELVETGESVAFRHSILFTRGLELRLKFTDFDFATFKPMDVAEGLIGQAGFTPSGTPR